MRGRSPCSGSGGSGPCRPSPGGSSRTVAGSRPRTRRPRPGSPAAGRAVGCRQGTPEPGPGSAGAGCRASRSSSDDPGPSPLQAHLTLESILPSGSLLIGQGGGLTVAVDRARGRHAPSDSEGLAKWWGVLFMLPLPSSRRVSSSGRGASSTGAGWRRGGFVHQFGSTSNRRRGFAVRRFLERRQGSVGGRPYGGPGGLHRGAKGEGPGRGVNRLSRTPRTARRSR